MKEKTTAQIIHDFNQLLIDEYDKILRKKAKIEEMRAFLDELK